MKTLRVVPLTRDEANRFVESFHRHSKPVVGCRFSIGCVANGSLVGVAIVGRPVARHLDDQTTAEVNRVCVRPDAPRNVGSFLYSRSWRIWQAMGGTRLVTYTLTTETGASLRGAGYRIIGHTRAEPWSRDSRPREWTPIQGQQKLRWERRTDVR